jgi:hypothetical protein
VPLGRDFDNSPHNLTLEDNEEYISRRFYWLFGGMRRLPYNTYNKTRKERSVIGRIEIYDPSAVSIVDSNAAIEVLGRNYKWTEGPVWVDGFKIDRHGNIFSAGPDGINIISPVGKLLGLIRVYDRPVSNCAFNETKEVLYITAADMVLRVKLK